jgi:hypothetical protein
MLGQSRVSRAVATGNVRRYRAARELLITELGGQCVQCGSTDHLTFDHLGKRTWVAARTSRWVRIARYRREADEGLVVLKCQRCNGQRWRNQYTDYGGGLCE